MEPLLSIISSIPPPLCEAVVSFSIKTNCIHLIEIKKIQMLN